MHRRFILLVALVSLMTVTAIAQANAAAPTTFRAVLSGGEEVAPNDSRARGVAIFHLSSDGQSLSYRLNVANIENVTQAHIHLAPVGVNGPVVAWLYPDGPPPQLVPGRTNGTLATGTITVADLVGPLALEEDLDALVEALVTGNAYVNVHTSQIPGGEIRGQIICPIP